MKNKKNILIKAIIENILNERLKILRQYNWQQQARPNQLPPEGPWKTWLILAGRGFGKTRTGAETIRSWVNQGLYKKIAFIGESRQEARSIMVEGESGILNIFPPKECPIFQSTTHQVIFKNGATATLYGGDYYEKLRGPQFDAIWIDEFAKFRYPQETWDQAMLTLRLGKQPRCIITTTPRPLPFLNKLMTMSGVVVTKGSTFDNEANLSPQFITHMRENYMGSALGTQELFAEILDNNEGALWKRSLISYTENFEIEKLNRVVIAIDPATTHHSQSDETGIIVAGIDSNNMGYILDDLSGRFSPTEWGKKVIETYWSLKADRIVAEVNKGGDLVGRVLKSIDPSVSYKEVRATRGKTTRAEPIAALYEQKKVFHTRHFKELEEQMCTYVQGRTSKSPDRMDALVWALTELFLESETKPTLKVWGQ